MNINIISTKIYTVAVCGEIFQHFGMVALTIFTVQVIDSECSNIEECRKCYSNK